MSSQSASAGLVPNLSMLPPGSPIGSRFCALELADQGPFGPVYLAQDNKTNRQVRVHLVAGLAPETLQILRQQVKRTMAIRHRNLLSTYGVGTHEEGCSYVVEEIAGGLTLSEFVAERQQRGEAGGLRAAFNIVAHVAKALGAIHESTFHGAVRPDVVHISTSGRVRLAELAVSQQLVDPSWAERVDHSQRAYLAPEIPRGLQAGVGADIFGLGGLLQWLLTGQAPGRQSRPPSFVREDTSPAVDALLSRCFAADPRARFSSTAEFIGELLPLVTAAPAEEPSAVGLDMEIEVDVDIAASIPPPRTLRTGDSSGNPDGAPRRSSHPPRIPAPPGGVAQRAPSPPQPGARAATPAGAPPPRPLPFAAVPAPPLAEPAVAAGNAPAFDDATAPPQRTAESNLKARLDELTQNDSPRWMATKDGMDHGPFTSRELIKQIVDGEVLPEHFIGDMHGGDRKPLAEYPEFEDFVSQYQLRKTEADRQAALDKSSKSEKRSNITKSLVLAGGLIAILAAGGTYFASRQAADDEDNLDDLDPTALFQGDEVKIEGTADVLKGQGKRKRTGARRKDGSADTAPFGSGFGSYEDAMNQAMELGDATRGGGERQLRREDVAATMNRHLNSMFGCVSQEQGRGGKVGNVRIDIAIRGSGSVMGASVRGGSPAFQRCVVGKVRQVQFPSFPAPRMGATYSFSAD